MHATQRIILERRRYNQWVASEMLEDYALRFTATQARKSTFRVGNTALGPIAFLACEAIGGAITLSHGFPNAALAIAGFVVLMFLIGLPICIYGARHGVDIDLLTRGAGFGYIGSTITSLIYASFTFLLFAIEASIMSVALQLLFGLPLAIGHLICALLVIPIALFGVSLISRMQMLTQPIWLVLQVLPLAYIVWRNPQDIAGWTSFAGLPGTDGSLNWLSLGAAGAVLLSLLPQIGEQVDYLRFMPQQTSSNRRSWWIAVIGAGPGWVIVGGFKLLVGSFLAYLLLTSGAIPSVAVEPTAMYRLAFGATFSSPTVTILVTGLFVIVCQLKINVTNAYAGSLAWSNFFSRVTHSHPGRVVWLVFNVIVALCLMEMGILHTIESVLAIYANFAAGWIGAITADLVVNKPLGLSPRGIEFKRAHLYDINPVGVGSLALSIVASSIALTGLLGPGMQTLAPFLSLLVAFVSAPIIAWVTGGRYYLARESNVPGDADSIHKCTICENSFEHVDMAMCPAYGGPICSLCCSLDARCRDRCKPEAKLSAQVGGALSTLLPDRVYQAVRSRAGRFFSLVLLAGLAIALLLTLILAQVAPMGDLGREVARETLTLVYVVAMILAGVAIWGVVLAHESRRAAETETERQTSMLLEEIEAHKRTDQQLQRAKEVAEAANLAKSRYIVGLGHEIRTPLNSIFGYAQLLERRPEGSPDNAIRVIRRSAEHLSGLVDGLLDMSNIEGGVLRLSRDKVNLPELLDQLEDMFRLQAEGKGIGFRCERPGHLPSFVHADQKRLRQILINLLSNAVKYTVRGEASLTVRYRNQVAEFEVSDTGIGIETPDLERIFEPFERGTGAAVRGIPGTGLGLTITKLLTQVMGGELSVRSSPGVGTTFVVRMFLSEATQDGKVDSVRWIRGYEGERKSILLIDDNVSHISILTSLFTSLGFRVNSAETGIGGVARAATSMPALAIVDISLPDMTGWETIGRIRTLPGGDRLRVVVASANAHESAPGGGTAVHDEFLVKPLDLSVLLASVQRQLQLTWLYKREALADPPEGGLVAAQLSDTAARHIDDLWQLGLIGHVRGIHAKLRDLDAEHPRNQTLAARLRSMVDRFDMSQYMNTLKEFRADD